MANQKVILAVRSGYSVFLSNQILGFTQADIHTACKAHTMSTKDPYPPPFLAAGLSESDILLVTEYLIGLR